MYDLWSFRTFEAVVCAGLGGGSLIYANVLLRRPEAWFSGRADDTGSESWPITYADLDDGYAKAEKMLGATVYPYADQTEKTRQIRDAADGAGLQWRPAPLAISFSPPGQSIGLPVGNAQDNLYTAHRSTCLLCGQCDVGCNYGSKNTTDLTYLSAAAKHPGTRIETLHEVRRIRPLRGGRDGFEVLARRHHPPDPLWNRNGQPVLPDVVTFRARTVVVSAGSLGSTYLLLRNRPRLPDLSPTLGSRFSGNGDYLGFVSAPRTRVFDASQAPVITGYLAAPDRQAGPATGADARYIVEDGGYPVLADWLGESLGLRPAGRVARVLWTIVRGKLAKSSNKEISSRLSDVVGEARRSSSIVPMLGMGCDHPDGRMSLRNGHLDISWRSAFSQPAFEPIKDAMQAMARSMDGHFHAGPSNLLSRMVTVHPLGGAPMGTDVDHGVVDSYGEVFNYPGLFVADGSVMPGPVGVNPSLTIAALSERFSTRVLERTA